jgi:hypothetical protein
MNLTCAADTVRGYVKKYKKVSSTARGSSQGYHCAASREVSGSIPSDVTGDFFRGCRRNHVPWG